METLPVVQNNVIIQSAEIPLLHSAEQTLMCCSTQNGRCSVYDQIGMTTTREVMVAITYIWNKLVWLHCILQSQTEGCFQQDHWEPSPPCNAQKSSALGRFCKTATNSAIIIRAVDLFSISTFDGQLIFKYCDRYGLNTWLAHSGKWLFCTIR